MRSTAIIIFTILLLGGQGACVTEYKKEEDIPVGERPTEQELEKQESAKRTYRISDFPIRTGWTSADKGISTVIAPYPKDVPGRLLLGDLPEPGDQGPQASGTAWAVGYAAVTHDMRIRYPEEEHYTCSPAFIYNRLNQGENEGIEIASALSLVNDDGCPHEKYMPYYSNDYMYSASAEARINATRYKIDGYGRVDFLDTRQVEAHLISGRVVIVNMNVYSNFLSLDQRVWEGPRGRPAGRHSVALIGFHRKDRRFIFMNSAGKSWGDDGYFELSYDWFIRLTNQAYIVW